MMMLQKLYINIINPLTPISDQGWISPYNINTISSRQVMRMEKNINLGIISWSNTKFSEQYVNCMVDSKENYKFDLGVRQIDSMLLYVCSLIDLRWGQNVVRTKKWPMKSCHVSVWLTFLSHFDTFCDLFLYLPTVTWNLFNLYNKQTVYGDII